jgi:hypothetical protein
VIRRSLLRSVVLPVFAVAALALGACQTRPATAAYVGDTRIPLSRIDELTRQAADDPISGSLVERFPGEAKTQIVQTVVQTEVLRRAADLEGLRVSESDVARMRRAIEPQRGLLQPAEKVVPLELLARNQAYLSAFQERISAGATSQEQAQARADAIIARTIERYPVTLNPRFGAFDPAALAIVPRTGAAVRPLPSASVAP